LSVFLSDCTAATATRVHEPGRAACHQDSTGDAKDANGQPPPIGLFAKDHQCRQHAEGDLGIIEHPQNARIDLPGAEVPQEEGHRRRNRPQIKQHPPLDRRRAERRQSAGHGEYTRNHHGPQIQQPEMPQPITSRQSRFPFHHQLVFYLSGGKTKVRDLDHHDARQHAARHTLHTEQHGNPHDPENRRHKIGHPETAAPPAVQQGHEKRGHDREQRHFMASQRLVGLDVDRVHQAVLHRPDQHQPQRLLPGQPA